MKLTHIRRRRGAIDFAAAAAVQTALAGTGGFALDFSDTSRMWTTSTKTTLVAAAADPIGAIRSKWGAAEYDILQSTDLRRPTWNGSTAADFVSASLHHMLGNAATALMRNKPAGFACSRVIFDSLATAPPVFALSTTTTSVSRFHLHVATNGALVLTVRRVDGAAATTATSAAGVITVGNSYVITMSCDYAGTGAISVRVDETQVISTTLTEAVGNTSDTNSLFYFGRTIGTSDYFDGRISRMVFGDKVFTAEEIANIEAWVGQGALT